MIDNSKIEQQIREEKKSVAYDTRELTIEILVKKYLDKLESEKNDLYVPAYQREIAVKYKKSGFLRYVQYLKNPDSMRVTGLEPARSPTRT